MIKKFIELLPKESQESLSFYESIRNNNIDYSTSKAKEAAYKE